MNTNAINNADVLKTVTVNHMVDGFKAFTKGWPVKFAGPAPTAEMLMVSLVFGKQRKPGPESGFVAMQLRPEGASVAELSAAFNSGPAHNHSRELSADNKGNGLHYFQRTKGNGRFWLTFTAKGVKALEKALASMAAVQAAGEATEAADKPKAKKATPVAKRGKATSEAPKAVTAIKVRYTSVDGVRHTKTFKSLKGAQAYAFERVGKHPELGSGYAVSSDGVGKVEVSGCTLQALFGDTMHAETVAERQLEGPVDSADQATNDGGGTADQQQQPTS